MVHYVFADKTGTMTCNKMEFHSMCIGSTEFGPKPQRKDSDKQPKLNSMIDEKTEEKLEFDYDKFNEYFTGNVQPVDFSLNLKS